MTVTRPVAAELEAIQALYNVDRFEPGDPIVAGDLIEDDAPLPHELQRGGAVWQAVCEAMPEVVTVSRPRGVQLDAEERERMLATVDNPNVVGALWDWYYIDDDSVIRRKPR